MTSNPLWDVLQAYMDSPLHEYAPRPADLARKTGVSEQVISKWKSKPMLPTPQQLGKVSAGTGLPFSYLLEAALQGKGYLPADVALTVRAMQESDDPSELPERVVRRMQALQYAIRHHLGEMSADEVAQFERRSEEHLDDYLRALLDQMVPRHEDTHAARGGDGDVEESRDSAPTRADYELAALDDAEHPPGVPED